MRASEVFHSVRARFTWRRFFRIAGVLGLLASLVTLIGWWHGGAAKGQDNQTPLMGLRGSDSEGVRCVFPERTAKEILQTLSMAGEPEKHKHLFVDRWVCSPGWSIRVLSLPERRGDCWSFWCNEDGTEAPVCVETNTDVSHLRVGHKRVVMGRIADIIILSENKLAVVLDNATVSHASQ